MRGGGGRELPPYPEPLTRASTLVSCDPQSLKPCGFGDQPKQSKVFDHPLFVFFFLLEGVLGSESKSKIGESPVFETTRSLGPQLLLSWDSCCEFKFVAAATATISSSTADCLAHAEDRSM